MKPIAKTLLFAAVIILTTAAPASPLPVIPGVPFALGPGQTAEVPGGDFVLLFTGIIGDSRCPQGAICVWEGDAEAAITGTLPGDVQMDCVLHTSPMFAQSCDLGPYTVTLLWVEPVPVAGGDPIDPADYIAHFVVVESGTVDVDKTPWGTVKALYF